MNRIGDDAFRHILLHTSLFLPVQNNCFMQLSGEPVYEKYQHYRPGNTFGDKQRDSPLAKSSLEPKNKKKKPGIIDPKRGQMISSERKKPNRPRSVLSSTPSLHTDQQTRRCQYSKTKTPLRPSRSSTKRIPHSRSASTAYVHSPCQLY
jgi:hypothetical protein